MFTTACLPVLFTPASVFPAGTTPAVAEQSVTTDSTRMAIKVTNDTLHPAADTAAPSPASTNPLSSPKPADSTALRSGKQQPHADTGRTPGAVAAQKPTKPMLPADTADTAAMKNGTYLSAGLGWTLGDFALMQLWESSQPDSLGGLGLTPASLSMPFDSTLGEGQIVDTARLAFSVKEKPANYTMCFPVMFSLVHIGEHDRMSLSAGGSWMRKVFAATIAATGDTLARKVDYKEAINVFSVFLTGIYGKRIPEEYLSIFDIERTYLSVGVQAVPVVAGTIWRTVTAPESQRYRAIADSISVPHRLLYGGSVGARVGLSMLKRVSSKRGMEFGAFFFINGYGYFRENGARVPFTGIDPAATKKNRNLFWISNGFELSIALLRLHKESSTIATGDGLMKRQSRESKKARQCLNEPSGSPAKPVVSESRK
jgi:hypothetical protein